MGSVNPTAIVVGGSLGGLSTALWLRDAGFTVKVFERSVTPLSGKGAGIVLNPYTIRFLEENNTLNLSELSIATSTFRYIQHGDDSVEIPASCRFASYNSLYAAFMAQVGSKNYHLDHRVTEIEQLPESVVVHTANGALHECDLLVCADGAGSDARRWLVGEDAAQYSGYTAWRGIVNEADLPADVLEKVGDCVVYHIAKDSHMLLYPIPVVDDDGVGRTRYSNWIWYRDQPLGSDFENLMTDVKGNFSPRSIPPGSVQQEHIDKLRADSATLPEPLHQLVQYTKLPFLQVVSDYEIPQMAFGRVCILGDAAFTVRPHIACGTAKAVEDGRQLGLALKELNGDIPAALKVWEEKQMLLGKSMIKRSREAGADLQNGTWEIGSIIPIGLYEAEDSYME